MNKIRSLKRLFGRKGVSRRQSLKFGRALPIRFAEYAELLEDRTLLAASLLDAPLEGMINQGSQNELQLTLPAAPGGSGPVSLGFLMSADHSSLNPAAIRFKNAAGTIIAPSFSDPNRAGGSQSLAVVNLGPGEFTVIVGADNNTSGAFTMDLFLPGDRDGNGDVSQNELLTTEAALIQRLFGGNHILAQFFSSQGIDFSTNLFHANMDANLNGLIDQFDVDQALINATSPSVNFGAIEFIGDNDAPAITARVTTDTGPSNTDNVTNNLNVEVTISDESNISSFSASLDGATPVDFSGFLIPGNLDPDGSTYRFSFTQNSFASTFGVPSASLVNTHTVSFFAEDELLNNNNANPFEFTFTLDQINPSLDNPISNQITNEDVDLNGIVDLSLVFSDNLSLNFSAISNDPSLVVPLISSPLSLDVQDDQNGTTTITVTATDQAGNSTQDTFDVTVTPVNDEPSFQVPASDTVLEDSGARTVANFAFNLDAGAPNESGQTFTFNIVGNTNPGLFTLAPAINAIGELTYGPADDANGSTTISVEMKDNGGTANSGDDTSQTLTFDINVTPVNDEPTFTKGPDQNVDEDSGTAGANTIPGWAGSISKGPANESSQVLTFNVTNDNNSLFSVQPNVNETTGDLTYTLAQHAFGSAEVTVKLMDDGGITNGGDDSSTQTFNINVSEVNDPPTGVDDGPIGVRNDTGITTTIDVLENDIDPDRDNPPPETDSLTLVEIVSSSTTAPGGGAISGGVGTININNNKIDYTPPDAQERDVTIVYRLQDNNPGDPSVQTTATLLILVRANQNPTPQDDNPASEFNQSTDEDTATTIVAATILLNDNDPDGDTVSLSGVNATSTKGAAVSINGSGDIEYDPSNSPTLQALPQGSSTTDTFDYTVGDGLGGSASATVTLTVTGVNDAPTVTDEIGNAAEDGPPVQINTGSDDIDSEDDATTLTYTILSQPSEGSASSSGNGTFTFDPGSDFQDLSLGETRDVTFTYKATDSRNADSNTGTVTITVTGVNDAPTVTDETGSATEDGPAVLINTGSDDIDSDDNASTLTYTILSQPSEGNASSNGNGTFTFDPGNDFQDLSLGETRQVNFTYKATDSRNADSNTGTVTITVTGVNDAPTVTDEIGNAAEDGPPVQINTGSDDIDSEDDATTLTYTILSQPSEGSASSNSNGSFTFDPGSDFQDLSTGETREVTFTYKATDSRNADSNTGTVTITVTGVNDAVTFLGLNDIVETLVDPPDRSVNLDNIFSDPEGGQPAYSNANSDNPLVNVSISGGNMLDISYTAYSATQDRSDPIATITVTATDPDDGGLMTPGTFDITLPQFTLDVQLVFRNTPTQPDEFTFFVADASDTTGVFQLVSNSPNSLIYLLSGLDANFDLDGTRTPGNPNDNVTALRFIDTSDSNAVIFDIINDDADLFIDAATGEVDGSWNDAEVDIDPFLGKLRNGQLAVQIVSNALTQIVGGETIKVTGQLATLPTSQTQFIVGESYVVEVWIKDLLSENLANNDSNGLVAASVDVTFDGNIASGGPVDFTDSVFSLLASGLADNVNGIVDSMGGGSLTPFSALDPAFARIGFVPFTADVAGNPNFNLAADAMDGVLRAVGSGGGGSIKIDASQYAITVPAIDHIVPFVFQVDMINSEVIVTVSVETVSAGDVQFDPQVVGVSDRASLSGTIDLFLDDLMNPTLIQLFGADVVLGNSGSFSPDPMNRTTAFSSSPANLGYQDLNVSILGQTGQLFFSYRGLSLNVDSLGEQMAVDGSGNFSQDFTQFSLNAGIFDFQIVVPAFGNVVPNSGNQDLSGLLFSRGNMAGDLPGPGQIVNNGGTWELTIPISHTFIETFVINNETVVFCYDVTGTVLATFTPPAPLLATEPQETEDPIDGTAIQMTLSRERTTLDTSGGIEVLPESEAWVHEWDSFWVELWASTTDGPGIESATVDLQYNTSYFTATEIDHGRLFRNETSGTISDDEGLIDDIGGVAAEDGAGGDGYVLLGRVKFESLEGDQVSAGIDNQFFGPFDLGLELSDAQIDVTGTDAVDVFLGESPETELWSVVYDINDDNEINFADFAVFSSVFRQDVFTGDSPFVSMMDFNNDGNVDFGDMAAFAGNFRLTKANGSSIQFPDRFTQRWAGTDIVTEGSTSVDDVVDAAVGAWQTALELANPFSIQVVVQDLGTDQLGDGQIIAVGVDGIPTHGRVVIDDDANGLGWYTGLGTPVPADLYDLYTVLLHEIGHSLGFSQYYAGFAEHVSTSPDGSTLFVGSDFTAVLTSDGLHLDDDAHANDVMSETLAPAVRKEISSLDVSILRAAYDAAQNGSSGFVGGASAALHADRQTVSQLPVSTSQTSDLSTIDLTTNASSETQTVKVVTETALVREIDVSSRQGVSNQDHSGTSSGFFKFPDNLQYDEPENQSVSLTVNIDHLTWLPPDLEEDSTDDESDGEVDLSLQSEHDSLSELDSVFTAWDGPIVSDGV